MDILVNIKSLLILIAVFILFTAIGTLTHEYGHIAIAKSLNYKTKLHYASMNYYPKGYLGDKDVNALKDLTKGYENIKYENWPKEVKEKTEEYNSILQKRYRNEKLNNGLLITIGGPLLTTLVGTIGLLILIWRRNNFHTNGFKIIDWLAVFLSLFWLRAVFNLVTSIGGELISPNGNWFSGDELHISQALNLWSGSISLISATLGLIVAIYVVFRIIPKKIRLTFILSGFIGGIAGFILWMNIIGPKLLPLE